MKEKGRGGTAVAMADDTFGGANNPASMVWVGNRYDVGVEYFRPIRGFDRTGSGGFGAGPIDSSGNSDSKNFFIPQFGYNQMINPNLALGVSVYGNGGLNTDFSGSAINCGYSGPS